jgi:hypothetical protein
VLLVAESVQLNGRSVGGSHQRSAAGRLVNLVSPWITGRTQPRSGVGPPLGCLSVLPDGRPLTPALCFAGTNAHRAGFFCIKTVKRGEASIPLALA